jgi:hypothetical protein
MWNEIREWGLQEWASFGTIVAPLVGFFSILTLLYPDWFREKNSVRRGEDDYLGLTSVRGGESFRRMKW